jgi:hypothetical protein
MERLNGVSSDKVKEQTGFGWAEWVEKLDGEQAFEKDHKAIAELVAEKYAVRPWWSQMVAVGYEQAKGLRVKYQTTGGFQISASRTFTSAVEKVFAAFDNQLAAWYNGPDFTITTSNLNKNIRGKFKDGTVFAIGFNKTPTGKTQVAIGHEKLETATAGEQARNQWRQQLDRLGNYLGERG